MNEFEGAWNEYWQSGFKTSCVSNGKDGYPESLINYWELFFKRFNNGNSILDLCSGGGGIPKLIIDYLNNSNTKLNVTMTDLSTIDYQLTSNENVKLKMLSNCNCEDLPFKENEYDMVTSSFGIEYSDLSTTIKEIYRVLKPGGYLCAVIHIYDSEVINNSTKQMQQGEEILYQLNFFKLFRNIYLAKNKSIVFQKSAEKKLSSCLTDIKTKLLHDTNLHVYRSTLKSAHDIFVFGQENSSMKCIKYIDSMENSLYQNYLRMKNLSEVHLSSDDRNSLVKELRSLNFEVITNNKIISEEGKSLGLGIICKK